MLAMSSGNKYSYFKFLTFQLHISDRKVDIFYRVSGKIQYYKNVA